MNMVPVTSSNLLSVGYDSQSNRLVIQFRDGTYEYSNVPSNIYQGLLSASSKGNYHHQHIKNSFPYRKIR
ncbi:KTSC domain-containing protein [Oceanobacillus kimchii]|uniref:KTSC domain-containing protein n=1 Tax=Oceanobacillus kimchii TaxID=746691 RepID=UPI0021A538AE|nr:KTSC domain-containing protein [Oceanobacillus kimchii]MCT1575685.1 KTSC domain-containing protein [Oceanobacillus kimchii]MCT2137315.1 KTSC domain-containing protein [Oceanobacillus kimchii]